MRAADLPELRGLDLFRGMAEESFDQLLRGAYVQRFPSQVELAAEGERADFLHVLIEGMVELYAGWSGRETTMATIRPVSTFILAATINDAPYLMSARTIGKSRIVLVPSEEVRRIFELDTGFARAVVWELANCYRSLVRSSKDLKLRGSVERVANYLLRNYERAGRPACFELTLEKRRLASYLGMTPENLSRAIKALRDHGVNVDGTTVVVDSASALQKIARPTPLIDDPHH